MPHPGNWLLPCKYSITQWQDRARLIQDRPTSKSLAYPVYPFCVSFYSPSCSPVQCCFLHLKLIQTGLVPAVLQRRLLPACLTFLSASLTRAMCVENILACLTHAMCLGNVLGDMCVLWWACWAWGIIYARITLYLLDFEWFCRHFWNYYVIQCFFIRGGIFNCARFVCLLVNKNIF